MRNYATEFWVGIFTLIGIGLALYMVFRTGDLRLERQPGYNIYIHFSNVAGLDVGDTVRVAGVMVGKVERIDLEENHGKVQIVVDHKVPLYEDATAQIKTYGLLGDRYVAIDPGHSRLPRVSPGDTIHTAVSPEDFDVLLGKLSEVATDIKIVTETFQKVLGGAEGEAALRDILQNSKDLSQQLVQVVKENQEQFHQLTTNLAGLTQEMQEMVSENRQAIQKTMATLPDTAENIRGITDEANRLLQAYHGDLGETLINLRKASVRLEGALKNIEEVSLKINEGEGTIGKLLMDEGLYEEAINTIREARNLVEDMREQAPISAFISVGGAAF